VELAKDFLMTKRDLGLVEKELHTSLLYAKEKEKEMAVFREIWIYSEAVKDKMSDLLEHLSDKSQVIGDDKLYKYIDKVKRAIKSVSIPTWLDKKIDSVLEDNRAELDSLAKEQALLFGHSDEEVKNLTWRQWIRE
jgi:hypothetical protein